MLLVICLVPFACALILFTFGFDRFMGSSDTPDIANAMRQIHSDSQLTEAETPKKLAASA
jgi:hypothetical protein